MIQQLRMLQTASNNDSEGKMLERNKLKAILPLPQKQSSIPLDRHHIEELIDRLDRDRTGMVDYRWVRPLVFACFHRWPIINVSQSHVISASCKLLR